MMTNGFLPGLLFVQLYFLAGAVVAFTIGAPWIGSGAIFGGVVFTYLIDTSFEPDKKTGVNGEILTILQSHTNDQVGIINGIRFGTRTNADLKEAERREHEFRRKIEIDPGDPRCLYRWKK